MYMHKKVAALTAAICLAVSSGAFAAQAPTGLVTPKLATDSDSTWLAWDRPAKGDDAVYYNVYQNGKKIGSTQTPIQTAGVQAMAKFQNENKDLCGDLLIYHSFEAKGLQPDTSYQFTVRAVGKDGKESGDSKVLTVRTTSAPKVVRLTDFGAKGDGTTVNTEALQKAIKATPKNGVLEVPAGTFVSGAVQLKSDMTLKLDKGAVLQCSLNVDDYQMEKPGGRYNGLLNGRDLENVRIVGEGTIDGSGWKQAKDGHYMKAGSKTREEDVFMYGKLAKVQTEYLEENDGRNFKEGYNGRGTTVILSHINNLYVEGIKLVNPSMHMVVVDHGDNVTFNNTTFLTYDANNGDVIDFTGSKYLVMNNYMDSGDDAINFNAGMGDKGAKNPPVSDAWIFNNYVRRAHGGITLGSHTASWIEKVLGEDNVFNGTDIAFRCKTSEGMMGGGRNCTFRHNVMKDMTQQAFLFTTKYTDTNDVGKFSGANPGVFKDMLIEDCAVQNTRKEGLRVEGMPGYEHHDITLRNVRMLNTKPDKVINGKNINYENVTTK